MSGHGWLHPLTVVPLPSEVKGAGIYAGGGDWKEQTGTKSLGSRELIACKIRVSCHLQPHWLARKGSLNGVLLPESFPKQKIRIHIQYIKP